MDTSSKHVIYSKAEYKEWENVNYYSISEDTPTYHINPHIYNECIASSDIYS